MPDKSIREEEEDMVDSARGGRVVARRQVSGYVLGRVCGTGRRVEFACRYCEIEDEDGGERGESVEIVRL